MPWVFVVLDDYDVEHSAPDWDLLGKAAQVYRVREFDSTDEVAAVAADLALSGGADRVLSFTEFSQFGAGYLAVLLGIGPADPLAHVAARDKRLMKARIAATGVRTTTWMSLPDPLAADAVGAAERLGFPLVIKPATGFGTHSTVRVDGPGMLAAALGDFTTRAPLKSRQLIAERFVPGRELHVDALWNGDEPLYFVISVYHAPRLSLVEGKWSGDEPVDGSRTLDPDDHPDLHARVLEMHRRVNRALGVHREATHLELFERPDGELIFSEVATRLGGGWIGGVLSEYLGYDVHRALAHALVHGEIPPTRPAHRHLGAVHLRPDRPGIITSMPTEAQMRQVDGVLHAQVLRSPGDHVDLTHPSDWCAFVVLGADSAAAYDALARRVVGELRIETEQQRGEPQC
ncbi:hypothetical protein ALI22I_09575 [Saccharothrix sp. ALI-22-I]|nr:hypothetical protein ALI22I_09575 [Saccharothrix sp. ALI-22-I]